MLVFSAVAATLATAVPSKGSLDCVTQTVEKNCIEAFNLIHT